jgi:clan AA aspartic protease
MDDVGSFRVPLQIAHLRGGPSDLVDALVDTGATYTWMPRGVLARLGIEPHQQRRFVLADGREVLYDVAWASVRIGDLSQPTLIVFGDPDSAPLLGVVTLEEFGLGVDPVNRRLVSVPGLLKRASMASEAGLGTTRSCRTPRAANCAAPQQCDDARGARRLYARPCRALHPLAFPAEED